MRRTPKLALSTWGSRAPRADRQPVARFVQGGHDMAAAYLLPRAEAALRQELQRLVDAVKRAREGQSSSSSISRAL